MNQYNMNSKKVKSEQERRRFLKEIKERELAKIRDSKVNEQLQKYG